MSWFIAVNQMSNSSEILGRVISSHRSLDAAIRACRRVQPNQRWNPGAYVPCIVRVSERRLSSGAFVPRYADWHTAVPYVPTDGGEP